MLDDNTLEILKEGFRKGTTISWDYALIVNIDND